MQTLSCHLLSIELTRYFLRIFNTIFVYICRYHISFYSHSKMYLKYLFILVLLMCPFKCSLVFLFVNEIFGKLSISKKNRLELSNFPHYQKYYFTKIYIHALNQIIGPGYEILFSQILMSHKIISAK